MVHRCVYIENGFNEIEFIIRLASRRGLADALSCNMGGYREKTRQLQWRYNLDGTITPIPITELVNEVDRFFDDMWKNAGIEQPVEFGCNILLSKANSFHDTIVFAQSHAAFDPDDANCHIDVNPRSDLYSRVYIDDPHLFIRFVPQSLVLRCRRLDARSKSIN